MEKMKRPWLYRGIISLVFLASIFLMPQKAFSAASEDREVAKARLGECWKQFGESCDLSGLNLGEEDLSQLYTEAMYEYPECFYVNISFGIVRINTDQGFLIIKPQYSQTPSKAKTMSAKMEKQVKQALAPVHKSWSDLEKILYIHDYLSTSVSYDLTYSKHTMYDAMVTKQAVCQGYCMAGKYLLNRLGVTCEVVWSKKLNHAWNAVLVNGKLYYMDITKDDPTIDTLGQARHTYFLKSAGYFYKDGEHNNTGDWRMTGGKTGLSVNSAKYDNYFWNQVRSRLVYLNGYWYAARQDGSIFRYRCNGSVFYKRKHIIRRKEIWGTHKNGKELNLADRFLMLATCQGQLFYSTPHAVYRLNLKNRVSTEVFRLSFAQQKKGWNYGMDMDEKGIIYYQYATASNLRGKISKGPSVWNYTAFSGVYKTKKGALLKWEKVSTAKGYYIYRKSAGGSWKLYKTIKGYRTGYYLDKSVRKRKGTYYYRIAAYGTRNGRKVVSKKSPACKVKYA